MFLHLFSDRVNVLPGDVQASAGVAEHVPLPEALEQRGPRVLLAAQGPRGQGDWRFVHADSTGEKETDIKTNRLLRKTIG